MRPLLAALSLVLVLPLAAIAQPTQRLPDLIEQPAFAASFDAMFKNERDVDAWIRDYTRTKNAAAIPVRAEKSGGRTYLSGGMCKSDDCPGNQLKIVFTEDGSRATAMLVTPRGTRWFGNPTAAEKALLEKF